MTLPEKRRRKRLQIDVTDAERAAIDNYRFARRVRNLSEAVRQLLMTGMVKPGQWPGRRTQ